MKLLVTGANGYIGSHVVKQLLDDGHTVYAADIKFDFVDERAIRLPVNIFEATENIFKETGEPDVCIHMAWRNGFVHNSDTHIEDLSKHFRFLKYMMEGGLKHIVVMGSMHEVGYWEGSINENSFTNPMSLYGISKNTLRQITEHLAKQYNVCMQWIRGYYILGDDLRSNSVFSKILKAEQEGKKQFPFNSGKNKYDFIEIHELAKQISAVAEQTEITGIINCCSGEPIALADKMEEFIEQHNLKIRLEYGAFPDREYDSPAVWGDNTKISKIMEKKK
ncbi:MAG: NAD(P)-dependent oxidoreductase [Lachnospiraceae bacterium]|nr:NAD(P)-dependent oxidoreductase [Lachnospiraceae bacterium]